MYYTYAKLHKSTEILGMSTLMGPKTKSQHMVPFPHNKRELLDKSIRADCRGLPISSLHVLEYNFYMGYKWIMANVNITRGNFE